MKKLRPILLALFVGVSIGRAEEPRQSVQVDGKTYPVYQWYKEVKPVSTASPEYPPGAFKDGRGGTVLVGATVNEKGKVTGTFVAKATADQDIQHAVRLSVAKWRFPKIKEGDVAISYVVFVPVSVQPPTE